MSALQTKERQREKRNLPERLSILLPYFYAIGRAMWFGLKTLVFNLCLCICAIFVYSQNNTCQLCNASPLIVADDEIFALLQLHKVNSKHAPPEEFTSTAEAALFGKDEADSEAREAHFVGGSFRTGKASGEKEDELAMADCNTSKWIFIWSTGRAGSTTIMSMLNHLPGIYLSGENHALADKLDSMRGETTKLASGAHVTEDASWYNHPNDEMLKSAVRMWICALRGDAPDSAEYRGFKELSHRSVTQIDTIVDVFPDAYHILNFRSNLTAQMESDFHGIQHTTEEALTSQVEAMRSSLSGKTVFEFPLEDFSTEKFNSIIEWLGMSTSCRFDFVLHQNDGGVDDRWTRDDGDPVTC
jgi:hypothetical protein